MRYFSVFEMRSIIIDIKEYHVQSYCKLIVGRLVSSALFRFPQCAEVQYHITNAFKIDIEPRPVSIFSDPVLSGHLY